MPFQVRRFPFRHPSPIQPMFDGAACQPDGATQREFGVAVDGLHDDRRRPMEADEHHARRFDLIQLPETFEKPYDDPGDVIPMSRETSRESGDCSGPCVLHKGAAACLHFDLHDLLRHSFS